jgi:hypothetical protein
MVSAQRSHRTNRACPSRAELAMSEAQTKAKSPKTADEREAVWSPGLPARQKVRPRLRITPVLITLPCRWVGRCGTPIWVQPGRATAPCASMSSIGAGGRGPCGRDDGQSANRSSTPAASQVNILRIRSRTSLPIRGRPPRERDFHHQYAAKPMRCQRTTVSGLTMVTASRMRGQRR